MMPSVDPEKELVEACRKSISKLMRESYRYFVGVCFPRTQGKGPGIAFDPSIEEEGGVIALTVIAPKKDIEANGKTIPQIKELFKRSVAQLSGRLGHEGLKPQYVDDPDAFILRCVVPCLQGNMVDMPRLVKDQGLARIMAESGCLPHEEFIYRRFYNKISKLSRTCHGENLSVKLEAVMRDPQWKNLDPEVFDRIQELVFPKPS